MQKIGALVAYFAMRLPYAQYGFSAAMGTTFLACEGLLEHCEFLFALAKVAGVLYRTSIRERGKVQQAKINAYCIIAIFQRFRFHLASKHHIPVIAFPFDGTRFDLPLFLDAVLF